MKWNAERANLENVIRTLKVNIAEFENRQVLLMIEIERLGGIVAELQGEVEIWHLRAMNTEEEKARSFYGSNLETSTEMRPQQEAIHRLDAEKYTLELQIQGYKTQVRELENKLSFLTAENENLQ